MCFTRSCLMTLRSDMCFSWIPFWPVETPAPLPLRCHWNISNISNISNDSPPLVPQDLPHYWTMKHGLTRFPLKGCDTIMKSARPMQVLTKLRNVKEEKIILITIIAAAKGCQ